MYGVDNLVLRSVIDHTIGDVSLVSRHYTPRKEYARQSLDRTVASLAPGGTWTLLSSHTPAYHTVRVHREQKIDDYSIGKKHQIILPHTSGRHIEPGDLSLIEVALYYPKHEIHKTQHIAELAAIAAAYNGLRGIIHIDMPVTKDTTPYLVQASRVA